MIEHVKTTLSYNKETKISPRNKEYFIKYLQYILTTDSSDLKKRKSTGEDEANIGKYTCTICNIDYKNALRYNKHIRDDDIGSIYYRLEAILPKYRPNNGCREFFRNNSDLKKHMEYHCHLTENEKMIFHIDNQGEVTINRRLSEHHGLPKHNTSVANDAVFYNANNKI